ncbi:MAG: S26 family signal peptidase [Actinomycetota bacterium]|nr:S26 family signal peptidase [Actinomycetota bacterium]
MAPPVTGHRSLAGATVLAAALGALGLWRWAHRVVVTGPSMSPALRPGDRLLVHRTRRVRRGHLAVVGDPRSPAREVVKRVAGVPGDTLVVDGRTLRADAGVLVVGDDRRHSTDSRHYGPVPRRLVRGRPWYRYAPPDRAGLL